MAEQISSRRLGRRRPDLGRRSRSRLMIEQLECRCLPSTVTNLDDAGAGSLRQALLDTPTGGVVDFQPGLSGTITLTTGELVLNKNLIIAGPGAAVLTVSGDSASRVFDVTGPFAVTLVGLTIAHGQAPLYQFGGGIDNAGTLIVTNSTLSDNFGIGGGIYNTGTLTLIDSTLSANYGSGINNMGTATVISSTLSGNLADSGAGIVNWGTMAIIGSTLSGNFAYDFIGFAGGIDNAGGALTVTSSTLSGNFGATGGAIYNRATLTVTSSTFSHNQAVFGGGIANYLKTATVTDSTLTDNTAAGGGGGIINYGGGHLTVTSSSLSGNTAFVGRGGGISNYVSSTVTIASSTLSSNAADYGSGGGIQNAGTLTVTNSTLSGNGADNGGGLVNNGGQATVASSTFSGNSAGATGGGLDQAGSGNLTVRNTLVAGNTALSSPDVVGPLDSQGHNLIGDGTGGSGYADTDLVGTAAEPIDPLLGPLQDNGGPTLTMALLPGSPAREAGDPTDAPEWDQRGPGFPRVVNGAIDIGAYEVQPGEGAAAQSPAQDQAQAVPFTVAFPATALAVFLPGVFATLPPSTPMPAWPVAASVTGMGPQSVARPMRSWAAQQAWDAMFHELDGAAADVLSADGSGESSYLFLEGVRL